LRHCLLLVLRLASCPVFDTTTNGGIGIRQVV
jgi:hypothetical protein